MPHKILLIDDDPAILDTLKVYLASGLGYDVVAVPTGEEGLEQAIEHAFDMAIIDVRLPGISGSETYQRLKSLCPSIEALFFTADTDFEKTMDFLRFSMPPERVITKPLDDLSPLTRLIIGILGPPTA